MRSQAIAEGETTDLTEPLTLRARQWVDILFTASERASCKFGAGGRERLLAEINQSLTLSHHQRLSVMVRRTERSANYSLCVFEFIVGGANQIGVLRATIEIGIVIRC